MTRYVALLRAINVGGHTVKMKKLRQLFEMMGHAGVETFIASGNIIFETSRRNPAVLEDTIAKGLEKALGFPVATFLRTVPELTAVAAHTPFPASDLESGASLYVGFMKGPAGPVGPVGPVGNDTLRAVAACRSEADDFAVHGRELYWLRRNVGIESLYSGARIEKTLAGPITMRNITTVRKLAEKYRSRS